VIPATCEAKDRRIGSEAGLRQKCETLLEKIIKPKKGLGHGLSGGMPV
jgi:hypothetical protein